MPKDNIQKMAKKAGKSKAEAEKLWDKAKKLAIEELGKDEKSFDDEDWAYTMGVFKNMLGLEESQMVTKPKFKEWTNIKLGKDGKELLDDILKYLYKGKASHVLSSVDIEIAEEDIYEIKRKGYVDLEGRNYLELCHDLLQQAIKGGSYKYEPDSNNGVINVMNRIQTFLNEFWNIEESILKEERKQYSIKVPKSIDNEFNRLLFNIGSRNYERNELLKSVDYNIVLNEKQIFNLIDFLEKYDIDGRSYIIDVTLPETIYDKSIGKYPRGYKSGNYMENIQETFNEEENKAIFIRDEFKNQFQLRTPSVVKIWKYTFFKSDIKKEKNYIRLLSNNTKIYSPIKRDIESGNWNRNGKLPDDIEITLISNKQVEINIYGEEANYNNDTTNGRILRLFWYLGLEDSFGFTVDMSDMKSLNLIESKKSFLTSKHTFKEYIDMLDGIYPTEEDDYEFDFDADEYTTNNMDNYSDYEDDEIEETMTSSSIGQITNPVIPPDEESDSYINNLISMATNEEMYDDDEMEEKEDGRKDNIKNFGNKRAKPFK